MEKYLNTILYNFTIAVICLSFAAGYSLQQAQQNQIYESGYQAGRVAFLADRLDDLNTPKKGI